MKYNAHRYILVSLILSNSLSVSLPRKQLTQAKENLKRKWYCAFSPEKYKCTTQERISSRHWLLGSSAATIVTLLAAVGIVVRTAYVKNIQNRAQKGVLQVKK